MKKAYQNPEMDVLKIEVEDIVTTSPAGGVGNENMGDTDWDEE